MGVRSAQEQRVERVFGAPLFDEHVSQRVVSLAKKAAAFFMCWARSVTLRMVRSNPGQQASADFWPIEAAF